MPIKVVRLLARKPPLLLKKCLSSSFWIYRKDMSLWHPQFFWVRWSYPYFFLAYRTGKSFGTRKQFIKLWILVREEVVLQITKSLQTISYLGHISPFVLSHVCLQITSWILFILEDDASLRCFFFYHWWHYLFFVRCWIKQIRNIVFIKLKMNYNDNEKSCSY